MTKILWCVLVSLSKYMRLFQRKDGLFFFSNVTLYSFFLQKNLTGEEFSGSLQLTVSSFAVRGSCAPWRQCLLMERCFQGRVLESATVELLEVLSLEFLGKGDCK